jgi:hypothetical protein
MQPPSQTADRFAGSANRTTSYETDSEK